MVHSVLDCLGPGRYFVAGTDTGVGKTLVTAALLSVFKDSGRLVQGIKPVAAGCEYNEHRQQWENEDALLLQQYCSFESHYAQVNPVALPRACSPHMAAADAGVALEAEPLAVQIKQLIHPSSEFVLIEGAGGWCAPINDQQTMATLAQALGFAVVLVVGLRLGCLNHAMLSQRAIQQDGLRLAGWVACQCEGDFMDAKENIDWLSYRLEAPLIGVVEHCQSSKKDAFVNYPVNAAVKYLSC